MTTANAMYNTPPQAGVLAAENIDLVKRIAYRLVSRLPTSVQVEDLIQAGMVGLLEAQQRYNPEAGASFATFSGMRIRGAMLDEIRLGDWTPRSVHRAARAAVKASGDVERRCGRPAVESEVAEELGVSLADYRKAQADARSAYLSSLDEAIDDHSAMPTPRAQDNPHNETEREYLYQAVVAAGDKLPERERLLMTLYYDRDLNLRQIAERLGVSESRACQLHSRALSRVREELQAWAA